MDIIYQALFKYEKENEGLLLTRILPDGSQDTSPVSHEDIKLAEETCRDFRWNQSPVLSEQIGKRLFDITNGDRQTLLQALNEADNYGEPLLVCIRPEGPASHWPFELLYHTGFLIPSRVHLVRCVSDRGCKRTPEPKDCPLSILFMAFSPKGISPGLQFEKEEDTIYEVTKDYPVEIDFEDTGTLYGLSECLVRNEYDIFHISGPTGISEEGVPFFFMEDEEGLPVKVAPERLWGKLKLNPPSLLFLSGHRTSKLSGHEAVFSFAHNLVAHHSSTVLGLGLPVSDTGASIAAGKLYSELSRGNDILHAVLAIRAELFTRNRMEWPLLRLFSDGTPINIPLVHEGQKRGPRKREIQYAYLLNSQVKVLKKGFVGRRRMIQRGLRCLKKQDEKIGLFLHGTSGLGKSCLAGRFCERLKDHTLVIVYGPLSEITFAEALKDAFLLAEDKKGQRVIKEEIEWPDKIRMLCSTAFQESPYLILLDDFDKNLTGIKERRQEVSIRAAPILEALLMYLPYSNKMSQLIITSRYPFSLTRSGVDLVDCNLESIGLTSLRGADKWKKVSELDRLSGYADTEIRKRLMEAGRGNPRLMEALNTVLKEVEDLDITSLLSAIKAKEEEFVQYHILRKILGSQKDAFQRVMRRCAIYRLPVSHKGIRLVCEGLKDWESHIKKAICLSLMKQNKDHGEDYLYWVTPLLRTGIFEELNEEERSQCHKAAFSYYQAALSEAAEYSPITALELIEHALKAGIHNIAIEAGGKLLLYLRESFAYKEAIFLGESILSRSLFKKRDEKFAAFLFQLGWMYHDTGDSKKAVEYYKKALSIDKKVFGDTYPRVAADLNNLGEARRALGEYKKAIEYYEQALSINKKIFGDTHPSVAKDLNNLGAAWHTLGEYKKAIEYYEQALSINKKIFGDTHPDVGIRLNNLGAAWYALGDSKKAVECFEQAYDIFLRFYGDEHPQSKIVKEWLDSL
jgi:tetratricopeptide (TPR) repeat protein